VTVTRRAVVKRLTHLPMALLASAILLVVGVVIGWLVRGGVGAAGVAAGIGLVVLSYVLSSVVIAVVDAINPRLLIPIGLAAYTLKFIVIGLVMWAIAASGWDGLAPMGVAIIAGVLVWTFAQSVWTYRAKILYVDPDDHE
jgi:ATP synthase protein I